MYSNLNFNFFLVDDEKDKKEEKLVPEKVLAIIEEAYPNSLTIDDMSRRFKSETEVVRNMVLELVNKKLVKPVGVGVPGAAGLDSAAGIFICILKPKVNFYHCTPIYIVLSFGIFKQMATAVDRKIFIR